MKNYYLAIDIGASSGRHIIGFFNEHGQLTIEEIHRFRNGPVKQNDHLVWDIDYLFKEIIKGIKMSLTKYGFITSMSIDTWGVDYVLMQGEKELLPCYCYRDDRTVRAINSVHRLINQKRLFDMTGCQFQPFNTIYQLYADKSAGRLAKATACLMMPEYFIYRLTGKKTKEITNAGTTGLYSAESRQIPNEMMEILQLPPYINGKISTPGTFVGGFKPDILAEVGGSIDVVLCTTHDTASAVEGMEIPFWTPYLSSGTWSLLGIKIEQPIINEVTRQANFSNEFGPDYTRLQKNIMGLWIVQQLAKEFGIDPKDAEQLAQTSNYKAIFNVNETAFKSPMSMITAIRDWFRDNDIEEPKTPADFINAAYRSLANSYRQALNELEEITNRTFDTLIVSGGGAHNRYLNLLTQKFTGRKIVPLPIEATAIGNIKSQLRTGNGKQDIRDL